MEKKNNENDENMKIILDKADKVAVDMLKLLDEEFKKLGITEKDLSSSLQFAVVKKMESHINLPK